MSSDLKFFLLIYNRDTDVLVEAREFEDSARATEAYELAEREAHESDARMDVVLVGSDSLDTVRTTHSNYFTGSARKRAQGLLRNLARS